jgi:anti-anti-sigma regulatory factor
MEDQGELKLRGVCSNVMDIFEITGFSEMFTIIE